MLPKLQWLDGYSGETVHELLAFEGRYRIDSLVLAFEQAMDQKAARVGEDNLTEEERIVLAIEALEREVNNGGYGQFFVNSSRVFTPIIVDSLRRIGCPTTAGFTQKALEIVQETPMTDEEIEHGTWMENEEREDALRECDNLYFQRPENIEESLFAFIKANRGKIEPVPMAEADRRRDPDSLGKRGQTRDTLHTAVEPTTASRVLKWILDSAMAWRRTGK